MQTESRTAADALTYVIERFERGEWQWGQEGKGLCVAVAIARAHSILRTSLRTTMDYLAHAMRERKRLVKHPDVTFLEYVKRSPITYNDAKGRTLEEVLTVLRKAKELAEA